MRKGITPIIAIIILLLITVALAGAAYTFLFGYWRGLTSKNFIASSYCPGGTIIVKVTNTGTEILKGSDFVDYYIDNPSVLADINTSLSLEEGKTGILIQDDNSGNNWTGFHTVYIGIVETQELTIQC